MDKPVTKGTLYGVSVGPGDPELLTLKAAKCIARCPVIAAPQTAGGQMLALEIARGALDLSDKTIVPLYFAMSRDAEKRRAAHAAAAQTLRGYLDAGQDAAVLNLGDISVYASFDALQALLQPQGYRVERIAGVPSFCAAAARLNRSLTGGMDEPLVISPGSAAGEALDLPGTKILMKTGKQLPAVLDELARRGLLECSAMVCNCGLPEEQVYLSLSGCKSSAEQAGYFSTILVKEA